MLAYAGASLPLLVLMMADNGSLTAVVPDRVVAEEIVRSVAATIGLIAAGADPDGTRRVGARNREPVPR